MKFIYASVLCLCTSLESILIKWVREHQHHNPSSLVLVLCTELAKIALCGMWVFIARVRKQANSAQLETRDNETLTREGTLSREETLPREGTPLLHQQIGTRRQQVHNWTQKLGPWVYLIPAFLYVVSNNLVYFALGQMSAPLFTLLVNLKIPMTGLMAKVLLAKRMGTKQWASLVLMSIGTVLALLRFQEDTHWATTLWGTLGVLLYATCSATAAVIMEYITRHVRYSQDIMEQNFQFALFSSLINLFLLLVTNSYKDFALLEAIHLLSIFSMVFNGFATAIVLKWAGSIVKTLAVAMSSILTALLGYAIWPDQYLPINYFVGAFLCLAALRLYILEKMSRSRPIS